MNGIPLWISIFAAGLSVGLIFADPGDPESPSVRPDSTVTAVAAADVETLAPGRADVMPAGNIATVASLEQRLAELEDRVVALEEAQIARPASGEASTDNAIDPLVPRTPAEQSVALVTAGFDTSEIDRILELHNQHQLERLEIRDQAAREGWLDTTDFRVALRNVGDRSARVRQELGDDGYDSYLYALGLSNRVALQSIIPQGEAALAGLRVGDIITAYAGDRVFRSSELQQATSAGERGEMVPIQVLRGEDILQFYLPRGPLGVTISGELEKPGE